MAAKIPDAAPDAEVAGYRPSTRTVAPTDFGLGELAQGVNAAAQVTDQADFKAAAPLALKLRGENQAQLETDAAPYVGAPGFAADQISKAQQRAAAALADPSLTPGVKRHLGELALDETARVGEQANIHEAKVRAEPILAMRTAQETSQINGGKTVFETTFGPKFQLLHDSFDGSSPGYAEAVTQAVDDATTAALAATPERYQGQVQQYLAVRRMEELAKASATEQAGVDHFVLKSGQDQAGAVINAITSSPLAFDNAKNVLLPAIADTMPAGLRKDVLHEFIGQAAVARVKGLLNQGNAAQAGAELADGRYDAFLPPKKKEELESEVAAAATIHGPRTVPEALANDALRAQVDAQAVSLAATGQPASGVDLDALNAKVGAAFGVQAQAHAIEQQIAARNARAALGAVGDQTNAQLITAAHAPLPDHNDPDFATKLPIAQGLAKAANDELAARGADPAGFAQRSIQPGDAGAQRAALWAQVLAAPDVATRQRVAATYVANIVGLQGKWGTAGNAMAIAPNADVQNAVASIVSAPPEQKAGYMSRVAALLDALPANFKAPNGEVISPQAQFTQQLAAAGLKPRDISALMDFGSDNAKMGIYAAAASDPTLSKPLDKSQFKGGEAGLRSDVTAALNPYLATVHPLPGAQALAEGRIDRTELMARWYMANQHMSAPQAVDAAVHDAAGQYTFVDSWRAPTKVLSGIKTNWLGGEFTPQAVLRAGMARALGDLTADNGKQLFQNGDPQNAAKVQAHAQWITAPDDSGVILMRPNNGRWATVGTRYGQDVSLTWSQVAQRAQTDTPLFQKPPPGAAHAPSGAPLSMPTPGAAQAALMETVKSTEHSANGSVSPKGALGLFQLMPDTVKTYAPRLGLPVDLDRAQNDAGYNRQVATAAMQDLQKRYGPNGTLLSIIAYNAGPGRLEGYKEPGTGVFHPGWLQTIGDPRTGAVSWQHFVDRIPYAETRAYAQRAYPELARRLGH